jgi:protocatechuate 4,5-dioxygenase beta chain
MIRLVLDGNIEGLCQWSDADILREGGNGGLEVKNWACAMGAIGATGATLIEYEPVYEWFAGCAFAELQPGARQPAGAASQSRTIEEPALAG